MPPIPAKRSTKRNRGSGSPSGKLRGSCPWWSAVPPEMVGGRESVVAMVLVLQSSRVVPSLASWRRVADDVLRTAPPLVSRISVTTATSGVRGRRRRLRGNIVGNRRPTVWRDAMVSPPCLTTVAGRGLRFVVPNRSQAALDDHRGKLIAVDQLDQDSAFLLNGSFPDHRLLRERT